VRVVLAEDLALLRDGLIRLLTAYDIEVVAAVDNGPSLLRVTVTDDGTGGADQSRGTGLRGIERRLGTFDGTLTLSSPPGGPTVATLELPCVLSSPKTSTS
jgi:glucose-6-phosphate-specific signal transduction histidine kinase